MKGIVLAGGSGTRLHPITLGISKQLLPVYDKPMIFYPLSVLLQAGITDILVITTPEDASSFRRLLGDGSQWGVRLSFEVQPKPEGLAQAFLIGREFVGKDRVCLVLGDNIFYGDQLSHLLRSAVGRTRGATVFGYKVRDPHHYGIVAFDGAGKATSIEEKPAKAKSNYAVTGLYFYDNRVLDIAAGIKPSPRGELEISDVNRRYLEMGELSVELMGRGFAWLDSGTFDSLQEASRFVQTVEQRQGVKIGCLEEIAYQSGLISREMVLSAAARFRKTGYGEYLRDLVDGSTPTEARLSPRYAGRRASD